MSCRKILVRNCVYAKNPLNGDPLHCSTYIILDSHNNYLWHENLFLCETTKSKSLNTVRSYASDLVMFSEMASPLGGWKNVTNKIMRGYINGAMYNSRKYSQQTLSRHITTIRSFYTWLHLKGYLEAPTNIDFDFRAIFDEGRSLEDTQDYAKQSFTSSYVDHGLFTALLAGTKCKSPFMTERSEITLRLGFETGTRASEVLQLDYPTIRKAINKARDENGGIWATTVVTIIGKGKVKRELHIPPDLCQKIIRYINNYRSKLSTFGPLLCTDKGAVILDSKFASTTYSTACKGALILRNSHQGYHALRKSFGTHLVAECYSQGRDPWVEVPRRLGHKDVRTTLSYIHFEALLNNRSKVLSELNMRSKKYKGLRYP